MPAPQSTPPGIPPGPDLPSTLSSPPPPTTPSLILVSFPTPQILMVTMNRPEKMNCLNDKAHQEMDKLWDWYDREGSLRCAVVTGALPVKKGKRAFCAGQDLKEWTTNNHSSDPPLRHPPGGFAGLSRRIGKKPIIAAIDGVCIGGGFEIICNTDLNLCTPSSVFSFPEISVGVVPLGGALPRLLTNVGLARASELVLTGKQLTAKEALKWGIVNRVVGEGENVVDEAVKLAGRICGMSPDGVIVARRGLRMGWSGLGVEAATREVEQGAGGMEGLERGLNMKEGLKAFVEKRKPRWVDSKL